MDKTLNNDKCKCGKGIEKYSVKFIIDPLSPEFVCFDCWTADKERKQAEVCVCGRCDKTLDGIDFIDHRFCLAPDKDGKTGWNLFCISCEPYVVRSEKH